MSMRWMFGLVGLVCSVGVLTLAGCTKIDPADRRGALQNEYALNNQRCTLRDGHVVATGDLVNHSGRSVGFAVTVRFFDGDVDLGRPRTTNHQEPLADGETWRWEVDLKITKTPTQLRCNVISVAIGNNVRRR